MRILKVEKEIYWTTDIDLAHFLYFNYESKCKRIHGHTPKIEVWIKGFPNENGVVFDFNHFSDIVKKLDHRILVPEHLVNYVDDGIIEVKTQNGSVLRLSADEVIIIPFPNTTSEYVSEYILEEIFKRADDNITWVKVCFWEDSRSKACTEAYVDYEEGDDE